MFSLLQMVNLSQLLIITLFYGGTCQNGTTAGSEFPAIKLSHLIFSHHVNIGFYPFLYSGSI